MLPGGVTVLCACSRWTGKVRRPAAAAEGCWVQTVLVSRVHAPVNASSPGLGLTSGVEYPRATPCRHATLCVSHGLRRGGQRQDCGSSCLSAGNCSFRCMDFPRFWVASVPTLCGIEARRVGRGQARGKRGMHSFSWGFGGGICVAGVDLLLNDFLPLGDKSLFPASLHALGGPATHSRRGPASFGPFPFLG